VRKISPQSISSEPATGTTIDITFTIPQTLDINRKPGIATSQNVGMAAYKIGLLTMHGTKKHKKILSATTWVDRGTVW